MKLLLKILDKFLKIIKTDRNTFVTYVLTLICAYIVVDRVTELIILAFTGMSVVYWGPITYTFALMIPWFAYFLAPASKFGYNNDKAKQSFFFAYILVLYIIAISFSVQSFNRLAWLLILTLPNYQEIITEFSYLIRPAFTAIALYLPVITFIPLIKWMYTKINDPIYPNTFMDSIGDYMGVDINPSSGPSGPYSLETKLCLDRGNSKPAKIIEDRRFQGTLIVGPSGVGKTTMVLEPLIAQDLERKYFYREVSKEMGFNALKGGIATLNRPYDAEFLNDNFHLGMLTPREGKEEKYKSYIRKMICNTTSSGEIIYRDIGLSTMSPDPDHLERVKDMAKAFNIPITVIDAADPNAPGVNPFAIPAPHVCALVINSVLANLYSGKENPWEAYVTNSAHRAIQNVVILIHIMHPKLNKGQLPTLAELSLCLTDFSHTEYLTEEMKKDEELAAKHSLLITYMEQNFYESAGKNREDTKRLIHFVLTHLDYILHTGATRQVVCNRDNNLDYSKILAEGGVVAVCTRYADCGGRAHRSIAQFFLNAIICGMEDTSTMDRRLPHFLYVDAFDQYATTDIMDFFTQGRKFKLGVTLTTHTIGGLLGGVGGMAQQILSNSPTKVSFGNCTQEDYAWWEKEFCVRREWSYGNSYDSDKEAYGSSLGNVSWDWKNTMAVGKQQGLGNREVIYKIKDKYGKNKVNFGLVDTVPSKYLSQQKSRRYNFARYCQARPEREAVEKNPRFDPKAVDFDSDNVEPIFMNTTDSTVFFNNDDAISFNIPKNNK